VTKKDTQKSEEREKDGPDKQREREKMESVDRAQKTFDEEEGERGRAHNRRE
jgi:hypothetical protein